MSYFRLYSKITRISYCLNVIVFICRNSSRPASALNRPHPLPLNPPWGSPASSCTLMLFICTAPVWIRFPSVNPFARFWVNTAPLSPYSVSLLMAIACLSLSTAMRLTVGPKVSIWYRSIFGATPRTTVGCSSKGVRVLTLSSVWFPCMIVAPLDTASSIKWRLLATAVGWTTVCGLPSGPNKVDIAAFRDSVNWCITVW